LAPFGVLDEERRVTVRREAISKVVIPCARQLLASEAFRVVPDPLHRSLAHSAHDDVNLSGGHLVEL
jgi:hypothetical protein